MRYTVALIVSMFISSAFAALPPPTEAEKARATEHAAKNAWNHKVGTYQLCLAMGRTAEKYRTRLKRAGKDVPPPTATAPCTDPGPYAPPTARAPQPLEAAEAHSPAGTAVSPPNTKAKAAETQNSRK
jgi:hypothetical protein